jgi:hypothetical protein
MPAKFETFEVIVCACCALAAANGDTSGHDFHCYDSPEPLSMVHEGHIVVGDTEAFYSTRACDGCGEHLAGDRLDATLMVPTH